NGLLNTMLVKTSRGFHAYFLYPEIGTVQNAIKINDMSIDIRADGGYVIAPPSRHHTNVQYRWIKNDILPLPEFFIKKEKKIIDLRPLYSGVSEGERNNSLVRLCGSWINDGLSFEECLEMALLWNEKNTPPLSEKEIRITIKSLIRKHLLNHNQTSIYYHEKNLLRLPIFTYSKEKIHKAEKIEVVFENKNVKRNWTVIPSIVYGLPGPFDEMIFMAINKIISELPKPISNPINIGSLKNIAKMIGYETFSGHVLNLIKNSIKRIKSINLLSETVYFDAVKKKFITDMFSIIDRVIFQGELDDNGDKIKNTYIWLNPVYLKNINAGYVSKIDYNIYFSLKSFIAKGIYRNLSPLFSISNLPIKISYKKLTQKLQIKQEKYLSDIRTQLNPAHKELIKFGIFKEIRYEQSKSNLLILYKK
ncbi:MAG: bifunctional DNA primase/polymerase, partial [candidate division WOR-3 bacterium]